jgi:hypothetical protein
MQQLDNSSHLANTATKINKRRFTANRLLLKIKKKLLKRQHLCQLLAFPIVGNVSWSMENTKSQHFAI